MKNVLYYLKVYQHFLKLALKKVRIYKIDFYIGSSVFICCQLMSLVSLFAIFNRIPVLAGWDFYSILFLQNYILFVLALCDFSSDNLWNFSGNMIVKGDYDFHIMKPYHSLFSIVISDIHIDSFGSIIISFLFIILSCFLGDINLHIGMFFISICSSVLLITSIKIVISSLAFKLRKCRALLFLCFQFLDACKYPITIYPLAIRFFLTLVIPFALASYYPSKSLLNNNDFMICIYLIIAIFMFVISVKIWNILATYYSGTGN